MSDYCGLPDCYIGLPHSHGGGDTSNIKLTATGGHVIGSVSINQLPQPVKLLAHLDDAELDKVRAIVREEIQALKPEPLDDIDAAIYCSGLEAEIERLKTNVRAWFSDIESLCIGWRGDGDPMATIERIRQSMEKYLSREDRAVTPEE